MKISRRELMAAGAIVPAVKPQPGAGLRRGMGPAAPGRAYRGEALREIAFPLGGIGTGTVSRGGYGNLRDWEIFNRPNKGGVMPFTFAALRLQGGGLKKPRIRVLERQPLPPFSGESGVERITGLGLPRFREAVFTGSYPFAHIAFRDAKLPVEVSLEAFNPMVPLDTDASSLPVAVLAYRVTSRAESPIGAAIAFSILNPVGYDGTSRLGGREAKFFGRNRNEARGDGGINGILLSSEKYPADSPRYGSVAVATHSSDISYRLAWEHGEWWDEFQKWWDEFAGKGRFPNSAAGVSGDGWSEYATLAAHFALKPGESRTVPFVLAWHFPNAENYGSGRERQAVLRNEYGTHWKSAWEPAVHTLKNLDTLKRQSAQYRDALYTSTLPEPVIDAVSSQASILRTNTVMVMEGKLTLAFEGCNDHAGCCPMNCTHVYNYEQAMAHVYPELERSMRETDFLVNMRPDGSMSFRTLVPLKQGGNDFRPAADGQMGTVMKVYREWRLSGDDEWLRKLWPNLKRALEYAWVQWDANRDGVMEGEQHNTYDIEFYGPNSMTGSLYLGALAAAARMARHLGDDAAAASYEGVLTQGREKLDAELWNGEYYVQRIDDRQPRAAKYQYGEGCLSDQLLGQWFAEVVDLGKVLRHEHIKAALGSVFRYNFRRDFEDFANTQRIYALNDEAGLLLCSWPRGKRPAIPFPYSDEVWTGIEYQVAAHLMYEGMVKEGLEIVRAARARYDGARRNPWNEIECGHHYARAMSSWSLLLALSGFHYSAPEKALRFHPRLNEAQFRCLFSAGTGWGVYRQTRTAGVLEASVELYGGELPVATVGVPAPAATVTAKAPPRAKAAVKGGIAKVELAEPRVLKPGEKLSISLA